MKACDRKTFGACICTRRTWLFICPLLSRARIEKNRCDRQIEFDARFFKSIKSRQTVEEQRHAIDFACPKMSPTRVKRYIEIRVILANDLDDKIDRLREFLRVVNETRL